MTDKKRYAVFFAPGTETALGRFGNAWLGFDPATGADLERPALAGVDGGAALEAIRTPARYGFHGTLKPPFLLAAGTSLSDLEDAIEDLVQNHMAFDLGRFEVRALGQFLAFVPVLPPSALDDLAAACVRVLDGFRAAPSEDELARRRQAGLTPRQEDLLVRWGYPYVFDQFRFHLTLTGPMPTEAQDRFLSALRGAAGDALAAPVRVNDVALFEDPGNGGRFRLRRRFALVR